VRSLLPKERSVEWWTADATIEFLRARDRTKPFFAFMSFQRPHAPITPPAPYDTMYKPSDVQLPPSVNDTFEGKPAEQLAMAKRSTYLTIPATGPSCRGSSPCTMGSSVSWITT
jgi:hypothetical protein